MLELRCASSDPLKKDGIGITIGKGCVSLDDGDPMPGFRERDTRAQAAYARSSD